MVGGGAKISVVLATYNGSAYLCQQLESLAAQSLLPFELIVGDDGSQDATCEVVGRFAQTSPFPVRWVSAVSERMGACANFFRLMQAAEGDYLMFCDQDDVWGPDKVQRSLSRLLELELAHGTTKPCLVHTDMVVTNEEGEEIAPSFWNYQCLDPRLSLNLCTSLAQNVVTGCTVLINRALLRASAPLPAVGPLMHDWWLVLACHAVGGHVSFISEPTLYYRQHSANAVGATVWSARHVFRRFWNTAKTRAQLQATQNQANALVQCYGGLMSATDTLLVKGYGSLGQMGWFAKRLWLWRHGVVKSGWLRTVGLYLYV